MKQQVNKLVAWTHKNALKRKNGPDEQNLPANFLRKVENHGN
jgi:hypothetical protein